MAIRSHFGSSVIGASFATAAFSSRHPSEPTFAPCLAAAMIPVVVYSDAYPDGEEVGDIAWGKSRRKISAVRKVVVTR